MIKVEMDPGGLDLVLRGLEDGLTDLRPVWEGPVHNIFTTMEKEVFAKEGAYGQDKWVPLNPAYAAWKERTEGPQMIMQLHGVLVTSLTEKGSPNHVFRDGPSFAEYGTSVPYAAAQNFGVLKSNLPARALIQVTKAEASRIADVILAFLLSKMRGRSR
jgi:phage gpG-like protein